MNAPPQLPLPFTHTPQYGRENFLWAASNDDARAWLARPAEWPQHRLALWGDAGSGKTHFLHIWAAESGGAIVAGPSLTSGPPNPGSIAPGPVAIDDADQCPDPIALLHLLNRCAEAGSAVLLAGRAPPARWPVALPDLRSRLRAITAVRIAPPEDSLLRALLARLLTERQLILAPDIQGWLLLRLPRTAQAVREAVARLDYAALATGRKLGRRIVADSCEDLMSMRENTAETAEHG